MFRRRTQGCGWLRLMIYQVAKSRRNQRAEPLPQLIKQRFVDVINKLLHRTAP